MTFPLLQPWSLKSSDARTLMFLRRQRLSRMARMRHFKVLCFAHLKSRRTGQASRFAGSKILTSSTLKLAERSLQMDEHFACVTPNSKHTTVGDNRVLIS